MTPTSVNNFISICCLCKREMHSCTPTGEPLPPAWNQSHGVCIECLPGYAKQLGLSQADTDRLLATARMPQDK